MGLLVGIFASSRFTIIVILLLCLLLQPSGAAELPGSTCGYDDQQNYYGCDQGRCCTIHGFCGSDVDHCVTYCWQQCPQQDHGVTAQGLYNYYNISNDNNIVNATHNEYYDPETKKMINGWDDDHHLFKQYSSSSSSSSSACATSLSNIRPVLRSNYALAAFRHPPITTTTTTAAAATYCGQCLKLRNLETRGVEAMVRIIDDHSAQGLELDRHTFSKLSTYGYGDAQTDHNGHLVLNYHFENCQD